MRRRRYHFGKVASVATLALFACALLPTVAYGAGAGARSRGGNLADIPGCSLTHGTAIMLLSTLPSCHLPPRNSAGPHGAGPGSRDAAADPACLTLPQQDALPPTCPWWYTTYQDQPQDYEDFNVAAFSPDSASLYVAGHRYREGAGDLIVARYDVQTGDRAWFAMRLDPSGMDSDPMALAVSPDGGTVYVAGYAGLDAVGGGNGKPTTTLDAFSAATGAVDWSVVLPRQDGSLNPLPVGMAVAPDGSRVYLATSNGRLLNGKLDVHATVRGFDPLNGEETWQATEHVGAVDELYSFAVSRDGKYLALAGTLHDVTAAAQYQFETLVFRTSDQTPAHAAWSQLWFDPDAHGCSFNTASQVAFTANDDVLVAGFTAHPLADVGDDNTRCDETVIAGGLISYNAVGGTTNWNYVQPLNCDQGLVIGACVYSIKLRVGASIATLAAIDSTFYAFDAGNGVLRWTHTAAVPPEQAGGWWYGAAASPAGDRFFGSFPASSAPPFGDILTAGYGAEGSEIFHAVFNRGAPAWGATGTDADAPMGMAVSPDGNWIAVVGYLSQPQPEASATPSTAGVIVYRNSSAPAPPPTLPEAPLAPILLLFGVAAARTRLGWRSAQ